MDATMMDYPLTLTHFVRRAKTYFGDNAIVTRRCDRSLARSDYASLVKNAERLAHALKKLGVKQGDRVGTLAWNHQAHFELYLAVPSFGAVLHTLNLRLHPTELAYIANHAGDRFVFVDESLLPLFEKFAGEVKSLERVIVIRDGGTGPLKEGYLDYDAIVGAEEPGYEFPDLDEKSAAMICYTSGTTGNPKGVVYSHRSMTLHTLGVCITDTLAMGERDVLLPVVPMFHANAWGLPFAALATGARVIMPGPHLDPLSLLELMANEKVTIAAGVPTIWIGILALLDKEPKRWDLSAMRTMVIGGSAAPPSMIDGFKKRHGLTVVHAWGMTETNPLGSVASIKSSLEKSSDEVLLSVKSSQGMAVPFVDTRHVGEDGKPLPWDGESMGELEVRGPWVAAGYLGGEGKDRFTADGWFKTGDVVTIDKHGYLRICDRSKDVIKSGGEWISSVALENALMSHPAVLEAAVFSAKHPKWDERPVAAIVWKEGKTATKDELEKHLEGQFAKFWLPDDYVFVAQIPRTSTGKFLKSKLREQYGDHLTKKG